MMRPQEYLICRNYHDEENNLVGLDVEIGQEIAAILGVEARFEETSWDSILAGVDSGRFDIACNGVVIPNSGRRSTISPRPTS